MHNHAPQDYICPICTALNGDENEHTLIRQTDIIYKDDLVTAVINSFFKKNNKGNVIVVPNKHFENIYEIEENYIQRINLVAQKIALKIKSEYKCHGITILQNNEPASDQHAFHYHMHIIPRFDNDKFYENFHDKVNTTAEERKIYADKLKF